MDKPIIVAVGSSNPTKVGAVRSVLARVYPNLEVIPVDAASGVPEQPIGQTETLRGARTRANAARAVTQADLGVGLEGGVVSSAWGAYTMGWVAIVDRTGRWGLAQSPWLLLPPAVAAAVLSGDELGPVMDRVSGQTDTKKHGGATGILTNDLFDRTASWEMAVACAMAPFLHPELYGDDNAAIAGAPAATSDADKTVDWTERLTIRLACDDDVPELRRLVNAAYQELADLGMNYTGTYQDEAITRARMKDRDVHLAFLDDRLVATVATDVRTDDGQPVLYIGQFAVTPELKRQGIGSFLMDYVERHAAGRGIDRLQLDTATTARHLVKFYQGLGYRVIDEVHWGDKTYRSYIMEKRLS